MPMTTKAFYFILLWSWGGNPEPYLWLTSIPLLILSQAWSVSDALIHSMAKFHHGSILPIPNNTCYFNVYLTNQFLDNRLCVHVCVSIYKYTCVHVSRN